MTRGTWPHRSPKKWDQSINTFLQSDNNTITLNTSEKNPLQSTSGKDALHQDLVEIVPLILDNILNFLKLF